jgi:Ca-activated chloride channel family protein
MIVLDVSNSMEVEDVVPSRLQKAKHLIRTLVNRLDGDRVGLVGFAGGAFVACPLTTDLSYLLETVQILTPKSIMSQGTDIGLGLEGAIKSLERGAQETGPSHVNAPSRAVILISDGEDHEEQAIKAAQQLKESGTKLYVFGIGTPQGGPVPIRDENGSAVGFKRDRQGKLVTSRFDPKELRQLAEKGGGQYWDISDSEKEVTELLQDLGTLNRTDYAERTFLVYEDRFQIPLVIAIILLFLEVSIPVRKVLILAIFLFSPKLYAEVSLKDPVSIDTYFENKKGLESFQNGDLEEAQKNFGAAQARDPSRPELQFNQGVVQFQKGEVESAVEAFQRSVQEAQKKGDSKILGKSLYNLGAAYAKKNQLKEAAESYASAIQNAIEQKDKKLEEQARKNLELLYQEMQKQKEQKKQDEQNKKQEKSKEGNSNPEKQENKEGSGQPKKEKEKDQGQDQSHPDQQQAQKKKQFKSEKMSPEDADRVMDELKNREKELQEKFNRQNGKANNHTKDW